jgi:hypothetical protein
MITYSNKNIYWNYFISIEDDLNNLSRFIEFDVRNENVFSIELVRLLISSSSEFEIVTKELCNIRDTTIRINNINDIRKNMLFFYPAIYDIEIIVPRFGLTYKPLINWKNNNNCDWWASYNSVKHTRNEKYKDANLKNVINSIGALYIANLYYYNSLQEKNLSKKINMEDTTLDLKPRPCLIKINDPSFYALPYNSAYID